MKTPLDSQALESIIRRFDSDERIVPLASREVSNALSLENSIMLHSRLERAAMNQITEGEATLSRYAIWAETLRGIVLDAAEKSRADVDTRRNLMRAANSLAAFSAIQWQLSPM